MSDLFDALQQHEKSQATNRPTRGSVQQIDGNRVNVLVRGSSTILRNVKAVGAASVIGQDVVLTWESGVPTAHIVGGMAETSNLVSFARGPAGPEGPEGPAGATGPEGPTGSVSAASTLGLIEQTATPTPPSEGTLLVYAKNDHNVYKQDANGVEAEIGTGTAGMIPADGWMQGSGWVRSTNTQFAMAGNLVYLFPKGTRVRWQEFGGSYKYGVVKSSSYSTYTYVNLVPNNTYAITASPSAMWFSPFANVGQFTYTPTIWADGGGSFYNLNVVQAYWSMVGNVMKLDVAFQILDKGSTAGHLHFTAPANAALTGTGGGFEAGVSGIWTQLIWTAGGTDILCRGGDGRSMLVSNYFPIVSVINPFT